MKAKGIPPPEREFKFLENRRFRFDFAWPDRKLALEVEGGTFFRRGRNGKIFTGRHTSTKGFESDCEKYNLAIIAGWRVLRVTSKMVRDGSALGFVEEFFRENSGRIFVS